MVTAGGADGKGTELSVDDDQRIDVSEHAGADPLLAIGIAGTAFPFVNGDHGAFCSLPRCLALAACCRLENKLRPGSGYLPPICPSGSAPFFPLKSQAFCEIHPVRGTTYANRSSPASAHGIAPSGRERRRS